MAPIRRYLRITRHSVLEVRIYMDNPADAQRWLLRPSVYPESSAYTAGSTNDAREAGSTRTTPLTRVVAAVRPLVLPKLREENQLAAAKKGKGRGGKRKGWKDVVVEDDFEVSIFLTETSTRHSILRKQKRAIDSASRGGSAEDSKMTGAGTSGVGRGGILREESEESAVEVTDVPAAATTEPGVGGEGNEDGGDLFVSEGEGGDVIAATTTKSNRGKRKRVDTGTDIDTDAGIGGNADGQGDEKKKMALETEYDGFSIYGRILCLVVKRRGGGKGKEGAGQGQAMMEGWIASTQAAEGGILDE